MLVWRSRPLDWTHACTRAIPTYLTHLAGEDTSKLPAGVFSSYTYYDTPNWVSPEHAYNMPDPDQNYLVIMCIKN